MLCVKEYGHLRCNYSRRHQEYQRIVPRSSKQFQNFNQNFQIVMKPKLEHHSALPVQFLFWTLLHSDKHCCLYSPVLKETQTFLSNIWWHKYSEPLSLPLKVFFLDHLHRLWDWKFLNNLLNSKYLYFFLSITTLRWKDFHASLLASCLAQWLHGEENIPNSTGPNLTCTKRKKLKPFRFVKNHVVLTYL